MARAINAKDNVIKKLNADYKSGVIGKTITRKELNAFAERHKFDTYPAFLAKTIVARATFDISMHLGEKLDTVVSKPKATKEKPKATTSVAVSATKDSVTTIDQPQIQHFIPKVDSTLLEFNISALIPKIDSDYVKFGHYADVERIISSKKFFPVYISGPSGNGKTSMVEQAHARNKLPMIRHNINAFTDEDQLIGRQTMRNGNVEIIEGPIILAMRHGFTVLLDEISAANPNTILCLQGILEGKAYYFKLKNELISPAPGFNIIVTDNTKGQGSSSGKYIGTNILNEAFLERFPVMFEQEFPPERVESAIAKQLMVSLNCYNETILSNLIKWTITIRKTFESGGSNDLIATRRLAHVIKTYAIYGDISKAVKLCVARFDDETRDGFFELWNKIVDPDVKGAMISPSAADDASLS